MYIELHNFLGASRLVGLDYLHLKHMLEPWSFQLRPEPHDQKTKEVFSYLSDNLVGIIKYDVRCEHLPPSNLICPP